MPVIVIAPDSFKGSCDATSVAQAMAKGVRQALPQAEVRLCPMADGGEGTLDAIRHALTNGGAGDVGEVTRGGDPPPECSLEAQKIRQHHAIVDDANGEPRRVPYLLLVNTQNTTQRAGRASAIIETARIVGLPDARLPVGERSTAGIGQLILRLLDDGVRRIEIGLGGTSTNDAGIGLLCALGLRIFDRNGQPARPTLEGLSDIEHIDAARIDARLKEAELVLLSDVDNPLCGPKGATRIFGPQKGLSNERLAQTDATILRFAERMDRLDGCPGENAGDRRIRELPGAGAAGGLGYALQWLGARRVPGAMRVAELARLPEKLRGADRALTGEGRSDRQTLMGKVPFAVASLAREAGVPATLVSGSIDANSLPDLLAVFESCHALMTPSMTLAEAMAQTETLLRQAAEALFKPS